MSATKEWLATARVTDTPAGDLIADMKSDPPLPDLFRDIEQMRSYLRSRGACWEAVAAVPAV